MGAAFALVGAPINEEDVVISDMGAAFALVGAPINEEDVVISDMGGYGPDALVTL